MPSKNSGDSSGPVRRSPRAPARVKVKFGDQQVQVRRGRKRKYSNTDDTENNSLSTLPPPAPSEIMSSQEIPVRVMIPSSSSIAKKRNNSNRKMDTFCWICHKIGDDQACLQCPRVFHYQCLGPKNRFTEDGICPECRLRSADGTELSDSVKRKLPVVLPLVLNKISVKAYTTFEAWKATDSSSQKLVCIMDLSVLQDRVNIEMQYKSTAAFLSDVKWILHNCHIVYGPQDPTTNKAKVLVNDCRSELIDMEACVECYIRSHDPNDNFSNPCKVEHTLVWAKMKGFPYWPAKVLKVIDSVANVRFFGSHDKARVPVNQCFLLSKNSPNEKMPKKANFQAALDEMNEHVHHLTDEHGVYHYAEPRTKFVPGNKNNVTKLNNKVQKPKPVSLKPRSEKVSTPVRVSVPVPVLVPEVPSANSSDEVIDVSDDEESGTEEPSSGGHEVGNFGEKLASPKKAFMNSLQLYRPPEAASSVAPFKVNSRAFIGDQQPVNNIPGMEYYVDDENPDTLSNPSHFLPGAAENLEDELPTSMEETIKTIVSHMINDIEGVQKYDYVQFQPDICHTGVPICTPVEPEIQLIDLTSRASIRNGHPHRVINDYGGIMVNQDDHMLSGQETENGTVSKAKFMHRINALVQEFLSENGDYHSDCEKRSLELKEETEKHKQRCDEIKNNTDLIIKGMKHSVESEKQKAVEEAKKLWEVESYEKIEEAKKLWVVEMYEKIEEAKKLWEVEMQQKIEDTNKLWEKKMHQKTGETNKLWESKIHQKTEETKANCNELQKRISEFEAQISSLKSKNEADVQAAIKKSKEQSRKEHAAAMETAKKKWKKEMAAAITSTKRTQWCAFCLKEARFFCCWNTSYCDEDCQRNHWMKHVNQCENISRNNESSTESSVLVTPQSDLTVGSKMSKKTSDNTNGQLLPTLRPNGQPVPRYINSGTNVTVSSIPLPAGRPTFIALPQKNSLVITAIKSNEVTPEVKRTIQVAGSSPKPADAKTTKD